MTTFAYILVAAIAGGVLSTLAAAATLALHSGWISRLVSFAVGALLGAVFLELLPEALEGGSAAQVMGIVLIGLLAFFLLEKLVLWRHAHGHEEHRADGDEVDRALADGPLELPAEDRVPDRAEGGEERDEPEVRRLGHQDTTELMGFVCHLTLA